MKKKMIFKFVGGPLDGKKIVGERGREKEVYRYYQLTDHGRIGQRFRTASDYAIEKLTREGLQQQQPHHFQPHVYEVVDRIDNGDVLMVLIQYIEPAGGKGDSPEPAV
jgi:hypothetical protein